MKNYQSETEKLLRRLGVNGSYIGFRYTVLGICLAIQDPALTTYICKGIYVEIANCYRANADSVERNIRTVVSVIWEHGDRDLLNEIFCRKLTARPRNTAFIDTLAQYVEERCMGRRT